MTDKITAGDLCKISRTDLEKAIESYRTRREAHRFIQSTQFDILVDGHHRYPPKAIVGLAAKSALGRVLEPKEFPGGESSASFRLLLERGFEIVTKKRSIGDIDATFSVGMADGRRFLLLESRGPDRNTQYSEGFESLLYSLADLDATLTSVSVESIQTRMLPIEQRRVIPPSFNLPARLRTLGNLQSLRRELASAATGVGQAHDATGGNPTRRIRIEFGIDQTIELRTLADVIGEDKAASEAPLRNFDFRPAPPVASAEQGIRKAVPTVTVMRHHAEMQAVLYDLLVGAHGADNVSAELIVASGRPADLVVRLPTGLEVYEIKTAKSPRECVREALGQLFEYSFWPGSPKCARIWIVGPSAIDLRTTDYLNALRSNFNLPIDYLRQRIPSLDIADEPMPGDE